MSASSSDLDPPSPGSPGLPGSREARPALVRPVAAPAVSVLSAAPPPISGRPAAPPPAEPRPVSDHFSEIRPISSHPGEARPRPVWARQGKAWPVSEYPDEAADMLPDVPTRPAEVTPPAPASPKRSGRTLRLLVLERDGPEPRRRAARRHRPAPGRRPRAPPPSDLSQGTGLQNWMEAMLRDRSSLQLDTTNICMVLHALWKKPARREFMLNDAEFRQKAFNAFVMDVLKAYQMWDKGDDGDVPVSYLQPMKKRKHDEHIAEKCGADDDSTDPSAAVGEPAVTDSGGDERHGAAAAAAAAGYDSDWRENSPEPTSQAATPGEGKVVRRRAAPGRRSGRQSSGRVGRPRRESTIDGETLDGLFRTDRQRAWTWTMAKDRPVTEDTIRDLCARVVGPLMRTAGRKVWRNDALLSLAKNSEDASGVPDSSFLFIRCTRCPELVFVDYPAIRRHWKQKCHFLACILCDMIFSSCRLVLAHLRVEHKEPVPEGWFRLVRCHPCRRSGFHSTEQVIGHMAGHRAERARNPATFPPFLTCYKRIRCNQCGLKLINHRTELADHYKRDPPALCNHDPARPPPLPCPACRRIWAGPAALAAHIRLSRGLCKTTVQPLSVAPSKGRGVDCAFCPVCSRGMDPGETLADHLMTHLAPGLRCVQCGLVVGSHLEMQAHLTFTWRCDCAACDTHVGRGSRLLQHIIEDHDGGRRLTGTARARPKRAKEDKGVCKICGRLSTRLKEHMKETHSTRHCSCCNKDVKLVTYRKHQAKIRNMEKLSCKVCGRALSSGWALRTHMRLHTGEKPYECELCDAAYAQKVVLKTHMKTAHGIIWPFGGVAATPPASVTETEVTTAQVLFQ